MTAADDPHAIPRVRVSLSARNELKNLARKLDGCGVCGDQVGVALRDYATRPSLEALLQGCRKLLSRDGYLIAEFGPQEAETPVQPPAEVNFFATTFGQPLHVFLDSPRWRELGVDPCRPPNRSRGTGLLPLHMDFVNAEKPPDLICLYCIRPDPLGGGETIVATMEGCERDIPAHLRATLEQRVYADGVVCDLVGVGGDVNPFAVINPAAEFRYRYTGHLASSAPDGSPLTAVRMLGAVLEDRVRRSSLNPGDLLIVDQHRALHGRLPLGGGQNELPECARRLMLLSFLRNYS